MKRRPKASRRSIYVPDDAWAQLVEIAAKEDRSVNAVVRIAIKNYLESRRG